MATTPWPQDQLDRFNLWTAHGGIFGDYQEHTSMDWRLRDRPALAETMLQLLGLLQHYLSCNSPAFNFNNMIITIVQVSVT